MFRIEDKYAPVATAVFCGFVGWLVSTIPAHRAPSLGLRISTIVLFGFFGALIGLILWWSNLRKD